MQVVIQLNDRSSTGYLHQPHVQIRLNMADRIISASSKSDKPHACFVGAAFSAYNGNATGTAFAIKCKCKRGMHYLIAS